MWLDRLTQAGRFASLHRSLLSHAWSPLSPFPTAVFLRFQLLSFSPRWFFLSFTWASFLFPLLLISSTTFLFDRLSFCLQLVFSSLTFIPFLLLFPPYLFSYFILFSFLFPFLLHFSLLLSFFFLPFPPQPDPLLPV